MKVWIADSIALHAMQSKPENMGGVVRFQTNVKGCDASVSVGEQVGNLNVGADDV